MALISIKRRNQLVSVLTLSPERYDPRRELQSQALETTLLKDIARIVRRTVQPSEKVGKCLVLDTSDAREGIISFRKQPVEGVDIGSAKKIIEPHQVIVSRLRPYLRQIAFVDPQIPLSEPATLICSTEFFVLSSVDARSIAFLVPFLLSEQVQTVFAASQEGGHHPRFDDSALMNLPIPETIMQRRETDSINVEECVRIFRQAEAKIVRMIEANTAAFDA